MTRSAARLALATVAVVLVSMTFGGAAAYAGYPDTVAGAHHDCGAGHNPLVGHYSIQVLIKALGTLSTSAVEYTTCKDALESAIHKAETVTHHSSTSTSTTGTRTTTSTRSGGKTTHPKGGATGPISSQQIDAAVTNGSQPQTLNGTIYTPGAITTRNSGFLSSIPDPVLAVLAAVILALAVLGGLAIRNLVRTRRTGP